MLQTILVRSLLAAAIAIMAVARESKAQLRRRQAPPGGVTAPTPQPVGARKRLPFVGAWEGRILPSPGVAGGDTPISMEIEPSKGSTGGYDGATIFPGNARAPHPHSAVRDGVLRWAQSNSGGGRWVYEARLVTPDSIEGTMTLRDWPQGRGAEPVLRFVLARRHGGTR